MKTASRSVRIGSDGSMVPDARDVELGHEEHLEESLGPVCFMSHLRKTDEGPILLLSECYVTRAISGLNHIQYSHNPKQNYGLDTTSSLDLNCC